MNAKAPLIILAICLFASGATAEDSSRDIGDGFEAELYPLRPIDTSSPRNTLRGFIDILDFYYSQANAVLESYRPSNRLFLSDEELARINSFEQRRDTIARALDLSQLPAALQTESHLTLLSLQLKEVLDRIDLPPLDQVPGAEAMASSEPRQWTIPHTEITIAQIVGGDRSGEYLFNAETVERIPEFYERVKTLPYREDSTPGIYERAAYGPGGLYHVIPPRWIGNLPGWAKARFFDQPVWKWVGIFVVLGAALLFAKIFRRVGRRFVRRRPDSRLRESWVRVLVPLSIVLVIPAVLHIFSENLRLTGQLFTITTQSLVTLLFLALTWTVWLSGNAVAESIVVSQHLRARSIDSQLIRLAARLIAIILSVAILVEGAARIGLPAYSVVAGLGVGGVAVALAARDSLANLLGSLVIMFEKPFRMGHWIKVGDVQGTVESVGFRSTRIRTFYDSVVSIPNDKVMNSAIDNLQVREFRRVKTTIQITYDTPVKKVEQFVNGIKELIKAHPDTRKDFFHVVLNDFGEHSLDVLVYFFLKVPDWSAELVQRQQVLLEIMHLAEDLGVRFAFPTETVHIESIAGGPGVAEKAI